MFAAPFSSVASRSPASRPLLPHRMKRVSTACRPRASSCGLETRRYAAAFAILTAQRRGDIPRCAADLLDGDLLDRPHRFARNPARRRQERPGDRDGYDGGDLPQVGALANGVVS
jgi:hypothetical protein